MRNDLEQFRNCGRRSAMQRRIRATGIVFAVCASRAFATDFSEIEPNENKSQATAVSLQCGDAIVGASLGVSTAPGDDSYDYFLVTPPAQTPGIYRYRLQFQADATLHGGRIRGLRQIGGVIDPATDVAVQATDSIGLTDFSQWYGFGSGGSIYYRVSGTPAAHGYRLVFSCTAVPPLQLRRPIETGQIYISAEDWWLYDDTFAAIPTLSRESEGRYVTLAPGSYYLAAARFNFANHLPSELPIQNDGYSPVVDNAGAALTSNVDSGTFTASFADEFGTVTTQTNLGPFDVMWVALNVVPPVPVACCFGDGSCQDLSIETCMNAGGRQQGYATACVTFVCPQPRACCFLDGSCLFKVPLDCLGLSQAEGSNCTPSPCVAAQACCVGACTCRFIYVEQCASLGGMTQGEGSACVGSICAFTCVKGDGNCDGQVNGFDIDPFVHAIVNGVDSNAPRPPLYPSDVWCWQQRSLWGDINHDGHFDNFDIDPFISCIIMGMSPCP